LVESRPFVPSKDFISAIKYLEYNGGVSFQSDLIEKGYLPVEIPPAFSMASFASSLSHLAADLNGFARRFSKCVFHSIPRLLHHRRLLGIPNPLHQLKLVAVIEEHWDELEAHMQASTLSLTRMAYVAGSSRGLERVGDFDSLDHERVVRSSASRYLLKADLSRFYHSLYTHSISWAVHTKAVAKAAQFDQGLYGNLIDQAVRNTQDKQTLGIPVGPVTSDLISEVLGTALDIELQSVRPSLKGLRYVDDYYLFFGTRSDAEAVLADLHSIANHFAVEINPLKTRILELPEPVQPAWKSELRLIQIRADYEKEDLFAFFSRAFDNASKYPGNNVLKYAVKHSAGFSISHENWPLYESFLLGSLVAEPSLAPTLAAVLSRYSEADYEFNEERLAETLAEIASYHARFKQGFEVSWALWIGKLLEVNLPAAVWGPVSQLDDPIVALLSLDLQSSGLADALDSSLWAQHMRSEHLYSENWLLAYEAVRKGWLNSVDGTDYIAGDDFFGRIADLEVEFYDTGTRDAATETGWLTAYLGG
jgi:hypothetical protein